MEITAADIATTATATRFQVHAKLLPCCNTGGHLLGTGAIQRTLHFLKKCKALPNRNRWRLQDHRPACPNLSNQKIEFFSMHTKHFLIGQVGQWCYNLHPPLLKNAPHPPRKSKVLWIKVAPSRWQPTKQHSNHSAYYNDFQLFFTSWTNISM